MDPILLGGIIAISSALLTGLIGFLNTWLSNYYTLQREREQWERQQEAEQKKIEREDQIKGTEYLTEIYFNAYNYLSLSENYSGDSPIPRYEPDILKVKKKATPWSGKSIMQLPKICDTNTKLRLKNGCGFYVLILRIPIKKRW